MSDFDAAVKRLEKMRSARHRIARAAKGHAKHEAIAENHALCLLLDEVDRLKAELAGSEERSRLLFKAKNHWADRARKAEAALAKYDCGLTIEAQAEIQAKNRELLTIVAKRSAELAAERELHRKHCGMECCEALDRPPAPEPTPSEEEVRIAADVFARRRATDKLLAGTEQPDLSQRIGCGGVLRCELAPGHHGPHKPWDPWKLLAALRKAEAELEVVKTELSVARSGFLK